MRACSSRAPPNKLRKVQGRRRGVQFPSSTFMNPLHLACGSSRRVPVSVHLGNGVAHGEHQPVRRLPSKSAVIFFRATAGKANRRIVSPVMAGVAGAKRAMGRLRHSILRRIGALHHARLSCRIDHALHFISGYLPAIAGQLGRATLRDELMEFPALNWDKCFLCTDALGSCRQSRT